MKHLIPLIAAAALGACAQGDVNEPVRTIGVVEDGRNVLQYTLTRSAAGIIPPVSNADIEAQSRRICPGGYTELARVREATRRISGIIYTDVTVTLVCA